MEQQMLKKLIYLCALSAFVSAGTYADEAQIDNETQEQVISVKLDGDEVQKSIEQLVCEGCKKKKIEPKEEDKLSCGRCKDKKKLPLFCHDETTSDETNNSG